MTELEKNIFDNLLNEIHYNAKFDLQDLSRVDAYKEVEGYLSKIVEGFGCHDYLFELAITKLYEKHGDQLLYFLYSILDCYCLHKDENIYSKDVAFAAFFTISFHYYRTRDIEKSLQLLQKNEYVNIFLHDYPLTYTIIGRYCNISEMYDKLLYCSMAAISEMEKIRKNHPERITVTPMGYQQVLENVALKVGAVSAICSLCDQMYFRGSYLNNCSGSNDGVLAVENLNNFNDYKKRMVSKIDKYDNIYDTVSFETLSLALKYIESSIEYNPSYGKYYFYKAKVIFYQNVFTYDEINLNEYQTIMSLLDKAIELEGQVLKDTKGTNEKVHQYRKFKKCVTEAIENTTTINKHSHNIYYSKKKEIIRLSKCPAPQNRFKPNFTEGEDYAFISYSTANFKRVYCDLLSLKSRNISFWYDGELIRPEDWKITIEEKIKNATCIICYLSAEFLRSEQITYELEFMKKHNKKIIWVDLTGEVLLSRIIKNTYKTLEDTKNISISPKMLNVITSLLNDSVSVISREYDPLSEIHISRIEGAIRADYSELIHSIESEDLIRKNNKIGVDGKESMLLEDYLINDKENSIFIVMDGISRSKEEIAKSKQSIARMVAETFANTIHQYISTSPVAIDDFSKAKMVLREGFRVANLKVKELLENNKEMYSGELPGAVGIVAVIIDRMLVYGSVGDCMGILVRGNQKIIFSQKQTTFAFDILEVENDRQCLMENYVNNINSEYGYGVVNGQDEAIDFFNISYVNLDKNDVIFLASDGVSDLIQFAKVESFIHKELEEILTMSDEQDLLAKKKYFDDKSVIKITITN